jgi:hypothetical protein
MAKIIRHRYPFELSLGLLLLIFGLAFFLAGQIFAVPQLALREAQNEYLGMLLVGIAVLIMVLIIWEEFLFPVRAHYEGDEVIFRNHRTKLKIQAAVYLLIPAIFVFIYLNFAVVQIRFFIWAGICVLAPIASKLVSGINNYNDFLKLTATSIKYKNNAEEGSFETDAISKITLVKDERKVLHKIQLSLTDEQQVTIDLDEMELEEYYHAIDEYMQSHFAKLIR